MAARKVRLSSAELDLLEYIAHNGTSTTTRFHSAGGPRLVKLGLVERKLKDGLFIDHITANGRDFLAPSAASVTKTLSPRALAARAKRKFKLKPGESIQTRGVLAGAYVRDVDEGTLTHSCIIDTRDHDVGVLCKRVKTENLGDGYGGDINAKPTCTTCFARDPRFGA